MVALADEKNLIHASQQGDLQAFETLIRHYQQMILALTFRMSGSWSDAEDLAQETFLQVHRQLQGFRAEAKFSSWIYRIAINLCLNWKKRSVRQAEVLQQWQSPETNVAPVSETTEQVQAALLKLNPKQRAAIILTEYDGHNHAQAAKVLGCSEPTVSWYLFTARAKLKTLLRELRRPGGEHE